MSQWETRVHDQSIWAALGEFGAQLDFAIARDTADPESVAGLQRLKVLLAFIGKRLEATESLLIHPGPLENIATNLSSARASLIAFVAEEAVNHVISANDHFDTALGHLAQLNAPWTSEDFGALRIAADQYRASMQCTAASAKEAVAELIRSTDGVRTELAKLREDIALGMTTHGAQTAAEFDKLKIDITAEKNRADGVITEFQSQFSNAQEGRLTVFGTTIADLNAKIVEHERQLAADKDRLQSEHSTAAASILQEMNERRDEIEKLVGVIGGLGMASGFEKVADAAKWSTRLWHGVTVASMIGVIGWLWYSFAAVVGAEKIEWTVIVARALVSAPFAVLAAYAAKQGDKYLEMQRQNRKLQLELTAVWPYLAPLPVEERHNFLTALGKKIFGRKDSGLSRKGDKSPATIIDVLASEELRDFVERAGPQIAPHLPAMMQSLPAVIEALRKPGK